MSIEKKLWDNYIYDIGQLKYGDVVFKVGSTMSGAVFATFPIKFQQVYIKRLGNWKPICYWASVIEGYDSDHRFYTYISLNDSGILVREEYHNDHCLFHYDEELYKWFKNEKNRQDFPTISKWLRETHAKK